MAVPGAAPDVPELAQTRRIGWGLALRLFAQILAFAACIVLMGLFAPPRPFLGVGVVFLTLRIIGDLARAFAGAHPFALAVEGHAKALGWATITIGMFAAADAFDPQSSLWQPGLALALAGFSLWGHHVHAEAAAPRLAKEEGTLGALCAVVGLGLLATAVPAPAPWDLVIPLSVLVLSTAIGARGVLRLLRRRNDRDPRDEEGWMAWYQEHFFRLTLLAGLVAAYLFLRGALVGVVPYLFLFEYGFAVAALGLVLWSLRNHLSKRLAVHPLASPHRRHEQAVERQGETSFDQVEDAVGRFLETGDGDAVRTLAAGLDRDGVPVHDAFAGIAAYRTDASILLIHPGWLYGARLASVLLVALAVRAFLGGIPLEERPVGLLSAAFGLVLAGGMYAVQWNRFGGPWWIKTAVAYGGILIFFWANGITAQSNEDGSTLFAFLIATPIGWAVAGLALGLPWIHPWRAYRHLPRPRFGYIGDDPLRAIQALRRRADVSLMRRGLWALVLGIVLFIIIGEVSRFVPPIAALFNVYLVGALVAVLQPLFVAAGLRLGQTQVRHRSERAQAQRRALLDDALGRLDAALTTPGRGPRPPGRSETR